MPTRAAACGGREASVRDPPSSRLTWGAAHSRRRFRCTDSLYSGPRSTNDVNINCQQGTLLPASLVAFRGGTHIGICLDGGLRVQLVAHEVGIVAAIDEVVG